jgi:hypothetical protein
MLAQPLPIGFDSIDGTGMGLLYSAISDFSQNEGCRETGVDCHSARITARTWLGASVVKAGAEARVDARSRSSDGAGQCHADRGLVEGIFDCVLKKAWSADAAQMAQSALAGPDNRMLGPELRHRGRSATRLSTVPKLKQIVNLCTEL